MNDGEMLLSVEPFFRSIRAPIVDDIHLLKGICLTEQTTDSSL